MSIGPKLSYEFDHVTPDFPENLATGPESSFTLSEISEYEVFQLLNYLKISKSTGIDSIPARVLKISAEIISNKINNKIFERSVFNQLYEL